MRRFIKFSLENFFLLFGGHLLIGGLQLFVQAEPGTRLGGANYFLLLVHRNLFKFLEGIGLLI